MSLPNEEVIALLKDQFVVGFRNIEEDKHVGLSHGYKAGQTAVGTTNGAGGRNVQLVVMSPDQTVLHVLPGFWHPEDLVTELKFATVLHRLWLDDGKTREEKLALFAAMHKAQVRRFSVDMIARSDWQDFDRVVEVMRARSEKRDTLLRDAAGDWLLDSHKQPRLKPTCQLLHERMAAQPFTKLGVFDMERYVDYGRPFYDNTAGIDKGKNVPAAAKSNAKRDKEKLEELKKKLAEEAKKAKGTQK